MERAFVIKSERIGLSVLNRDDIPEIWKIMSDSDVNRYLNARWRVHYLENEYEWYDSLTQKSESERVFGIVETGNSKIIGAVFLNNINYKNGNSQIGFFLDKVHWRKGIMTDAIELLKKYSFIELNMRKLYTSAFEPNEGSRRVLEKTGFQNVGRYKSHVFIPNKGFVDELIYEVFNENLTFRTD